MKEFISMIATVSMCIALCYCACTHAKIYQKRLEYKCRIECADKVIQEYNPQKSQQKRLNTCLKKC